MAYIPLPITEKFQGSNPDVVISTRRLAAPVIIQPEYTFDVSDMMVAAVANAVDGSLYLWPRTIKLVRETSLGPTLYWSGGMLNASVNNINTATTIYVDGSLATRDAYLSVLNTSVGKLNASMNTIFSLVLTTNSSLGILTLRHNTTESSLGLLTTRVTVAETSIGVLFTNNYVKQASLGYGLAWHAGKLDVSLFLDDLTDVSVHNPIDMQAFQFESSSNLWVNAYTINVDDIFSTIDYVDYAFIRKNDTCDVSTSTVMKFDKTVGYVYGTVTTPLSGSITISNASAGIGVTNLLIHKNNAGFTCPSTFKKLSGVYDPCVNNYIYVQYLDTSNQLYTINSAIG